ncbi:hypothetical protein HK102_000435 [Quaeritorhiza haematococci]|nr:hypothetical protein HK102_000435 [Quaeritorhiza haematococci]
MADIKPTRRFLRPALLIPLLQFTGSVVANIQLQDEFNPFVSSASLVSMIISRNPLAGMRDRVTGGTVLAATTDCEQEHQVASGETCEAISRIPEYVHQYGLNLDKLRLYNPGLCENGVDVYENQKICVKAPIPNFCSETYPIGTLESTCSSIVQKILQLNASALVGGDIVPQDDMSLSQMSEAMLILRAINDHLKQNTEEDAGERVLNCDELPINRLLCIKTSFGVSVAAPPSKNSVPVASGNGTTVGGARPGGVNGTVLPGNGTLSVNGTAAANATATRNATTTTTTTRTQSPTPSPTNQDEQQQEQNNNNNNENNEQQQQQENQQQQEQQQEQQQNQNQGGGGGGGGCGGGDFLGPHNEARTARGVAPLGYSCDLANESQGWANACNFNHADTRENLAMNTGGCGNAGGFNLWMAEEGTSADGHFRQLMNSDHSVLGCGKTDCGGWCMVVCRYR